MSGEYIFQNNSSESPQDHNYTMDDYRLEIAAHEGNMSEKERATLDIFGTTPEATFMNNLIGFLQKGSKERIALDESKRILQESAGGAFLQQRLERREEMIRAIDEIAEEEGIDFDLISANSTHNQIFTDRRDDIIRVYVRLRNLGFTAKELAA